MSGKPMYQKGGSGFGSSSGFRDAQDYDDVVRASQLTRARERNKRDLAADQNAKARVTLPSTMDEWLKREV
jgi:hypothetical protein